MVGKCSTSLNFPFLSFRPRKKCGSSALFFSSRYASKDYTSSSVVCVFVGVDSSNATSEGNMRLDVNQEIITPRVPQFSAELNVENLCCKQTNQLKVLIVTPNG